MSKLDEIQARVDKATTGPWFAEGEPEEAFNPRTVYYVFHNGDTMDRDKIADSYGPDAEFIAHAREDVPKLVGAIRAIQTAMDHLDTARAEGLIYTYGQIQRSIRDAITEALG